MRGPSGSWWATPLPGRKAIVTLIAFTLGLAVGIPIALWLGPQSESSSSLGISADVSCELRGRDARIGLEEAEVSVRVAYRTAPGDRARLALGLAWVEDPAQRWAFRPTPAIRSLGVIGTRRETVEAREWLRAQQAIGYTTLPAPAQAGGPAQGTVVLQLMGWLEGPVVLPLVIGVFESRGPTSSLEMQAHCSSE